MENIIFVILGILFGVAFGFLFFGNTLEAIFWLIFAIFYFSIIFLYYVE